MATTNRGTFTLFGTGGEALLVEVGAFAQDTAFTLWGTAGEAVLATVNPDTGVADATLWGTSGEALLGQTVFGESEEEDFGTPTFNLNLSVIGPDYGEPTFDLELEVEEYGSPTFDLDLIVYDPTFVNANPMRWLPNVIFDGVDVTDDCIGAVEVEAEEGVARIARFSMLAPTGPLDLTTWVGKPVIVNFQQVDENQLPLITVRMFTGVVDIPEYDPTDNVATFSCIDNLMGVVGQHSRAALDSLIGGWWSQHVFAPDSNSLDYAQQQLSTVPKSVDMDAYAVIRATPWAATATPHFTFDEDTKILDESPRFEFANRGEVKNRVELEFQYRFPRLRSRRAGASWSMPALDTIIGFDFTIPTKQMVEGAADGVSGWQRTGLSYYEPPVSQTVGLFIWICAPIVAAQLAWAAAVALVRRWHQTVTEVYPLRVESTKSISTLGVIKLEETVGMEVPDGVFDADGWEADLGRSPGPSYPVDLPSNGPPYPRAGASDVIGWEMSGHGADFFHDITDVAPYTRADMDYALQTVLNKAKTTILLSHRGTKMLFSAPLNPFLDLIHTAYVDHSRVQAQGKVQSISWKMDPDGGSAIMDVKIAISSTGAGGLDVEDPLEAPPVPADPTYTPPPPRSGETRFGQMTTSQFPQADTTEVSTGYLGNRTLDSHPDFDSGKPYVEEFRFSAPEIEDALTEPLDEEQPEVVYIVNVPEDLLILN